jgi:hypothetical protein
MTKVEVVEMVEIFSEHLIEDALEVLGYDSMT